MDSGKHGAGNVSNKEDKEMTIRIECTSENERIESSEGDLIIDTSNNDNDCSNAESSAEESASIADISPRLKNLDLTSTDKSKRHMLLLQNEREDSRKFENVKSVTDLATPYNVTETAISDIQDKNGSKLSIASNWKSKYNISTSHSNDFPKKSRRKHMLPEDIRLKIKQGLENGESQVSLAHLYNVSRREIAEIKKEMESSLAFTSLKERKAAKRTQVDNATYTWYLEELYNDKMVTRPVLCRKAEELNENLGGFSDFKASNYWLGKFVSRHEIKGLLRKGKSSNTDICPSDSRLLYLYDESGLGLFSRDDSYCVVETTIKWPPMPQSSVIANHLNEKNIQTPERVTVLFCANTTWSHSLPLLVIGNKERYQTAPSCRLIYKSQKNNSMDSEMFRNWYTNQFIPKVKEKYGPAGKRGKVLLCIHSVRFDLDVDTLKVIDKNFEVKSFDPNVTSVDHMKLKRIFKTNVLQRLLSPTQNEGEVRVYSHKLLLVDYNILDDVWNILSEEKRKEASKQQMGVPEEQNAAVFSSEINIEEFLELFRRIPGCAHSSKENALKWLLIDTINSDDQILNVSERVTPSKPEELLQNYDTDDVDTDDKRRPTAL